MTVKNAKKKVKRTKITEKMLLEAIEGSFGIISTIAQRLNVQRQSVYVVLDRYPAANELLKQEREKIVDLAEAKLISKINEGSESMIALVLKTLGRERGYVEKQNIISENLNYNIDLSKLSDEELKELKSKIVKGEPITEYLKQLKII